MPNENVQLIDSGDVKRLAAMSVEAIPLDMPKDVFRVWTGSGGVTAFNAAIRRTLIPPEKIVASIGADFAEKLKAQENFWRRLFPTLDFGFDPDNMLVWPRLAGRDRLLVTPRDLWGNRLFEKYGEKKIPCWRYMEDLDRMIHLSGSPYVATARWFRDRQEADEELAGKSAVDLEQMLIPGITLPERELYGLVYFEEKGQHLDLKNVTLASGSRDPFGRVPGVRFRDRVRVNLYDAGNQDPRLRSRAAA